MRGLQLTGALNGATVPFERFCPGLCETVLLQQRQGAGLSIHCIVSGDRTATLKWTCYLLVRALDSSVRCACLGAAAVRC